MKKAIDINKPYLWVPIHTKGTKERLSFYIEGMKVLELMVPIQEGTEIDYYATIPVSKYLGKELEITGTEKKYFYETIQLEEAPYCIDVKRPQIHFTANTGWINDPNGLVYHNGRYHLYFQYNPFDVEWENMSWGHAVSKDLLHWEQKDTVLWPDEHGTIFSGCGIKNEQGLLGLDKNAILYYYSAAGNANEWSKGKAFTQGIAYSLDGGMNLTKYEKTRIPTIEKENRDPKVFWHEESNAYIMVLWLQEDEFAILRSKDLEQFEISQRLRLEQAFECPDLFRLQVAGTEEFKWVFWCADGFYYVGEFDGYMFTNESGRLEAYASDVPYAAQTISGIEDRVVSIPWLRAKFTDQLYTGAMGIPREFFLINTEIGVRLQQLPCKEYFKAREVSRVIEGQEMKREGLFEEFHNGVMELELKFSAKEQGNISIVLGKEVLSIDLDNKIFCCMEKVRSYEKLNALENLSIIIDGQLVEFTGKNGIIYSVYELPECVEFNTIHIQTTDMQQLENVTIYKIEKRN